jgi:hypothetical protein
MTETLESRYANDATLLEFYRNRLAKAGWGGSKDPVEKAYVYSTRRGEGKRQRGRPFGSNGRPLPVAAQRTPASALEGGL